MKLVKRGMLLVALLLTLGAASCGSDGEQTSVGQVAVATGLELYNQPSNELTKVAASADAIYLSAEILNPVSTSRVRIRWYRLPSQLISTEDFLGKRDQANKFDFMLNSKSSFLASSITKDSLAWVLGEYRVEIFINNEIAKTISFDIVSDNEASEGALTAIVRNIITGDSLNNKFKIVAPKSTFTRGTDNIFVQTSIKNAVPGTSVAIKIRYVKEDRIFANFTYEVIGDEDIVVDLERNRFGKLWSDRLWPEGAFEVMVYVNNIEVSSHIFLVKAS